MEGRDAVLGAGALGLTVALRLAQQGRQVTVFERASLPGGLAAGFEVEPGMWLEKFYHHLFRSDHMAIALIAELGLADDLVWHRPITATHRDGRTWQLDSALSLLRFGPLSLIDRARMGAVLAYLRAVPSADSLEGRRAGAWIRRYMGESAYDRVWGPLLRGKFGAKADEIAMPWFWARVHDRSTELGYLSGGFQRLYDALAERIVAAGGNLWLGTTVESIEPNAEGLAIGWSQIGRTSLDRFARVVSTLPTRLTCRLTPSLPETYRQRYDWGSALGAHCLVLALDRRLTGSYWLNVADSGYPFMAVVEHTNMRPIGEYGGRHLVYIGNYRAMDDPIFTADPDALVDAYTPHLRRLAGRFERGWITERWVFSAPFAQPIVTTDYREHIPGFETPVAGLYVANMFQVYPHDRGQNYSIALAERLIATLTDPQEGLQGS